MDDILDIAKPQFEAMNQMYKNGFEDGKRAAHKEFADALRKILEALPNISAKLK